MRRGAWLGAGIVLITVGVLAWRAKQSGAAGNEALAREEWDPLPRIVTVEVQNGGDRPGAARDAALRLRRARLDVVAWGNAPPALRDTATTTVRVLIRRGDTTGAGRVEEVFGAIEIVDAPDPRRLVDLSVIVPREIREP